MQYQVSIDRNILDGNIPLPSSKSISNRVLIINALSNNPQEISNLSDSDDTVVLKNILSSATDNPDVGHAGTAMRFLTAYFSKTTGRRTLTGSSRMKERPISILVDALIKLGAHIEYVGEEGFPPLMIDGAELKGGDITLDGSVSSQYISALLMIAPTLKGGLNLKLDGLITSRTYIELTLKLMSDFGVNFSWKGDIITIPEQSYKSRKFKVEADWSAASYWYQALALAKEGSLMLENLSLESSQGDRYLADWFEEFGIVSVQNDNGVLITKKEDLKPDFIERDFIENPDIAQTFAVLCVAKGIPFNFTGLHTLKIKETDRILALQNELSKLGAVLVESAEGDLMWNGTLHSDNLDEIPIIKSYDDHRMALSFAPLALTGKSVIIDDPLVVNKSYPSFWNHLQSVGFKIG